ARLGGGHGIVGRRGRWRGHPWLRPRHRKPAGGVMTDHLLRSHAPISDSAWSAIDDEARSRLTAQLAARKLVDFIGPSGWEPSAAPLGRTVDLDSPFDTVVAQQRTVLPLVELRVEFTLARRELDDVDRGASDPDLGPLDTAAGDFARAENQAVFQGFAAAGI